MGHTFASEFESLRQLSARIGADRLLTQAAGGNTSIKDSDTMWIKASGTWLADALAKDIFVPVNTPPLLAAIAASDPVAERAQEFTIAARNPSGLRPSIETSVHALMSQRVVLHVHCVDTIALAVRTDAQAAIAPLLDGLNWAWVRYCRPGLPLALGIAEHSAQRPDVLVLGNHGLAVAADSVSEAEALLRDVKQRLRQPERAAPSADLGWLGEQAATSGYRLPASQDAHRAATDPANLPFAAGGSLYPDHVIFLGVGSAVARPGESATEALGRLGTRPVELLFPGKGVLLRDDANAGAEAMAGCLADVLIRVPDKVTLRYLTAQENDELTNWDAEKYRQKLNAQNAENAA